MVDLTTGDLLSIAALVYGILLPHAKSRSLLP